MPTSDVATAPTNVDATVGDFDADPNDDDSDDIRVTWTASSGARIDSYTVEVYEDDNNAATDCAAGTFVDSTTVAGNVTTADVEELDDDTYCVVVYATSRTGDDSDYSAPDVATVQVGPVDATAPVINFVALTTDAATTGVIDGGDTVTYRFSEAMADTTDDQLNAG